MNDLLVKPFDPDQLFAILLWARVVAPPFSSRQAATMWNSPRLRTGTVVEKDNRILDLQNAAATIKAGYESQLSASRQLEGEHRMRADKAEAARQISQESIETIKLEFASAKGQIEAMALRNQAMEEKLTENITLNTLAQSELSRTKDQLNEAITENGLLSQQCTTLTLMLEQKTADLTAAKAAIGAPS